LKGKKQTNHHNQYQKHNQKQSYEDYKNCPLRSRSQNPSHLLHRILLNFISVQSVKHKRDKEEKKIAWEH